MIHHGRMWGPLIIPLYEPSSADLKWCYLTWNLLSDSADRCPEDAFYGKYGRRGLDLTHQATSRDGCKSELKLVPGDASHVKLSRWRVASQRHLNWHLCRPNDWKGWKVEITSENVALNMSQIGGLVTRLKTHFPSFSIIFRINITQNWE